MKLFQTTSHFSLIISFLLFITGCKCAHYKEINFKVCDAKTNAPISNALVKVDLQGQMSVVNTGGTYSLCQHGYTDKNGIWKATFPTKHFGILYVECDGYDHDSSGIAENAFDNGMLEIKLSRKEK
jgi:hypothetical protein